MDDGPDIRFVNPHSKCICTNDHSFPVVDPVFLFYAAFITSKPCMVVIRNDSLHLQQFAYFFCSLAATAIDKGASFDIFQYVNYLVDLGVNHESAIGKV